MRRSQLQVSLLLFALILRPISTIRKTISDDCNLVLGYCPYDGFEGVAGPGQGHLGVG